MARTTRFTPDEDAREVVLQARDLPALVTDPDPYDPYFGDCDTRAVAVSVRVEHYRTTIDLGHPSLAVDDRYFALGILPEHLECQHVVSNSPDRFGYARCSECRVWIWHMGWVASGLYGLGNNPADPSFDLDTHVYAENLCARYVERLPKLRLV